VGSIAAHAAGGMIVERDIMVAARDGIGLATDLSPLSRTPISPPS
jgi:hypothetical protein